MHNLILSSNSVTSVGACRGLFDLEVGDWPIHNIDVNEIKVNAALNGPEYSCLLLNRDQLAWYKY